MKKLLLLLFCTINLVGSETKHTFKAIDNVSGVCIKENTIACFNGASVDYQQDLIYDMANYKYTDLSSSLKDNQLTDFFKNSAFKKSAYYYDNNGETAYLKPFA